MISMGHFMPELPTLIVLSLASAISLPILLALLLPSYRIVLAGVLSSWIGALATMMSGVGAWRDGVEYFGAIGLVVIVVIDVLHWPIAGSFVLGALSTALFKLRLPRQFPSGHCRMCGYSLRGLSHQRCPECGAENAACGGLQHMS